jgi:hypothetical protein
MKMAVFWVVARCRLIALMMEAVQTPETSVNSYQSTWRYNPEDSHLQITNILKGYKKCQSLLRDKKTTIKKRFSMFNDSLRLKSQWQHKKFPCQKKKSMMKRQILKATSLNEILTHSD